MKALSPIAAAVLLALGIGAGTPVHAQDAELQALKQQLQQLQQKVADLEAKQQAAAAAPAVVTSTPAPASSTSAGTAAPSAAFYAGPVKVTLSGFAETMVVARDKYEGEDWASSFNANIPYPNSHNYDLSEFHVTERQSRIAALAEGPSDATYKTEAYVETDFGGATGNGNYNQSGSFGPRVRHFFADYQSIANGWYFLFGQNWSMVTASRQGMMPRSENIPLTIDGQYVPGFDWLRVAQIRLVKNYAKLLSVGVSIENPAAQIAGTASSNADYLATGATNAYVTGTNLATDYLPDLVGKVALDPGWGHYELFALTRWFRSRDILTGAVGNEVTHGDGIGGSVLIPLVPNLLELDVRALVGRGIGRYGSSGLPDATIDPINGSLTPLYGAHGLAGLVVRPNPKLTAFVYAGIEHVNSQAYFVGATAYGYGNLSYNNAGCEIEPTVAAIASVTAGPLAAGGGCAANTSSIVSGMIGGWWKFYQGSLGNLQLGLTDTYVQRQIFAGVGGRPTTDINIVLASLRYYPYQR